MGKKKEQEEGVKESGISKAGGPGVAEAPKPEGYKTQSWKVAELLNSKGVHPVGASGAPMEFFYNPEDSPFIKEILEKAEVPQ